MDGNNKRVLMFCVSFFGYEKRLRDALEKQGFLVDLYDERPNNGFVAKTCVRYNVPFYRGVVTRHFEQIIEKNRDKDYDYVFVVKGEAVNEQAVDLLRRAYPRAKFILYLWDSVVNIPECEKRMKKYDHVMSFDPNDAKKYGVGYLPIPYDEKSFAYSQTEEYTYDAAFVGTAHSVRPRVVKQIEKICQEQGRSCYHFFYSPHILVYLLNRLTNPNYRWIQRNEISFKPLSAQQIHEIYRSSRCALDIEHPRQSGATTRPVEMLPMQKKIITTNVHVKEFPFFNSNNFCIIDRENPQIPEDFWDKPYLPVDEKILKQYAPEEFVKKLFD